MSKDEINEFKQDLLGFVKRASQKGATAEEVEALPAVARVVVDAIIEGL